MSGGHFAELGGGVCCTDGVDDGLAPLGELVRVRHDAVRLQRLHHADESAAAAGVTRGDDDDGAEVVGDLVAEGVDHLPAAVGPLVEVELEGALHHAVVFQGDAAGDGVADGVRRGLMGVELDVGGHQLLALLVLAALEDLLVGLRGDAAGDHVPDPADRDDDGQEDQDFHGVHLLFGALQCSD